MRRDGGPREVCMRDFDTNLAYGQDGSLICYMGGGSEDTSNFTFLFGSSV